MTQVTKPVKHEDERAEILDTFRDHDRRIWDKFQLAKLARRHAASVTMDRAFQRQIDDLACGIAEEIEDDEIATLVQQAYTTLLMIAGYDWQEADRIAVVFAATYPRRRRYGL